MRSWVWDGWITEVKKDSFWTELERNDERIFAELYNHEVREEDQEYIKEGAYLTWYVTTKGCAIRFLNYVYKPSDIKRAEIKAREWRKLLGDD